jgi:hypothetical protein
MDPARESYMAQLGEIASSFAILERFVDGILVMFVGNAVILRCLVGHVSFVRKVEMLSRLLKKSRIDEVVKKELQDLLDECKRCASLRNDHLHSVYGFRPIDKEMFRIKLLSFEADEHVDQKIITKDILSIMRVIQSIGEKTPAFVQQARHSIESSMR